MDSVSTELTRFGLILDKALGLQFGISFIFGGPITVALSQVALAIRELAINSRKEYRSSDSDYKSLDWIATIFFSIGWVMLGAGVILVLKSL